MNRRQFLQATGAAAAVTTSSLSTQAQINPPPRRGPNDTIRMGVLGVRGRGLTHIKGFEALDGVEIVALADPDAEWLNKRGDELDQQTGRKVARHADLRKLLEDKSIDAVSVATPNHWHTLAAIWAMQAGKDVYVEKPCSHNVWEGRQLVKAARRYGRMCQHGTQSRSSPAVKEAMKLLHEGVIGDVYMARGLCYRWRDTIGHAPDEPAPPPGVDYDLWLGPAPKRPFSKNRFHYEWHWNWDYGNGDVGNQGVHQMDVGRWGLQVGLPSRIQSMGGRFMFDDDKQVPNCQVSSFFFPEQNKIFHFEVRHWIGNHESEFSSGESGDVDVLFYGSKGYMIVDDVHGYRTYLGRKREPGPRCDSQETPGWPDFIKAVRSRNEADLNVSVEEAHKSSALCHLANISYRTGRTINFDPKTEAIVGDTEANALLTRTYREPYVVPADL